MSLAQAVNAVRTVPSRPRRYAAQLRSLKGIAQFAGSVLSDEEESGTIKINFPSMPEELDLTRVAEYTVHNNQVFPDGLHVYKHTSPLEIPLSFQLSAFDSEYYNQGPIGLLVLGAKLHALTLPIIKSVVSSTTQTDGRQAGQPAVSGDEAGVANKSDNSDSEPTFKSADDQEFLFPPVAVLDLITGLTGGAGNSPGIRCLGYVSRASVKLRGPWMSSKDGQFRNLPSSAKYDFTFVHAPSFTNDFLNGNLKDSKIQTVQAGAKQVFELFYNTLSLTEQANLTARGFDEDFANQLTATGRSTPFASGAPFQ